MTAIPKPIPHALIDAELIEVEDKQPTTKKAVDNTVKTKSQDQQAVLESAKAELLRRAKNPDLIRDINRGFEVAEERALDESGLAIQGMYGSEWNSMVRLYVGKDAFWSGPKNPKKDPLTGKAIAPHGTKPPLWHVIPVPIRQRSLWSGRGYLVQLDDHGGEVQWGDCVMVKILYDEYLKTIKSSTLRELEKPLEAVRAANEKAGQAGYGTGVFKEEITVSEQKLK